jgi:hypothetical protein
MQRGIALYQVDNLPSNHYVYDMICKELNKAICRREQCNVKLKSCNKDYQEFLLNELQRYNIEFEILNGLKTRIEHPKYHDEVCDGNN